MRKILHIVLSVIALCYAWSAMAETPAMARARNNTRIKAESLSGRYVELKSLSDPRRHALPLETAKSKYSKRSAIPSSQPLRAEGGVDGTFIYGSLDWSDNWDDDYSPYGIYRMPINGSDDGIRFVKINDQLKAACGIYKDGKYHFIICYSSLWGNKFPYYSVADTENRWNLIVDEMDVPETSVATDMTYDAVSDKVYGCFKNADTFSYDFATFDLETGLTSVIAPMPETILCMAASNEGRIFGVGYTGTLYEFDKTTGATTEIGNTGVQSDYVSSACFDPATNKMYWNVSVESDDFEVTSYLYEVNTTDASLRRVCQPSLNEQFTAMFIFPPKAEAAAPGSPKQLAVEIDADNEMAGTLLFNLPSETYEGKPLAGSLQYAATINGADLAEGTGNAGQTISVPFSVAQAQECTFEVSAWNEHGSSPLATVKKWIGPDVPSAVENITIKYDTALGGFNLAWQCSPKGTHGDAIDPTRISYNVVRNPGAVTVATNLADTKLFDAVNMPDQYTVYSYTITPVHAETAGEEAISPAASLGSILPPYNEDFFSKAGLDVYNIINPKGDETWSWTLRDDGESCASIRYNVVAAMDDWMITPPVHLEAGKKYLFSFDAAASGGFWTERLSAAWGTAPTAEAMQNVIVPELELNDANFTTLSGWVNITSTGDYYFGIHGASSANQHTLYVDNVKIAAGVSLDAPGAPKLSGSTDQTGATIITVEVTAPSSTLNGVALSSLEKIELFREETLIHTFTDITPGQTLTYTDPQAANGINRYSAIAYSTDGAGDAGTAEIWAGFDVPAAPTNVHLTETEIGKVVISWNAPTAGMHGGPIDTSRLRYSIVRGTDEEVVALHIAETTYTDTPYANGEQGTVNYFILPSTNLGEGAGVMSDAIIVGAPYSLPFVESFTNAGLNYPTWLIRRPADSQAVWGVTPVYDNPNVAPADSDDGMALFTPTKAGEKATLISGKIDIKDAVNPVVDFYYYYIPGTDKLLMEVETATEPLRTIATFDFAENEATHAGWLKGRVELGQIEADWIRLGFTGVSGNGNNCMFVDRIELTDVANNDLGIVSLAAPLRPAAGKTTPVNITVANYGVLPATDYTIELLCNDVVVNTFIGFDLAPGESMSYTHAYSVPANAPQKTHWEARVIYQPDERETNNTAEAYSFAAANPYPAPTNLKASVAANGEVTLTWDAPDTSMDMPVTESAEQYESFIVDYIGDWTLIDGDGSWTYSLQMNENSTYNYPNAGAPMAFQVIAPAEMGLPASFVAEMKPHTGDKMFASFAATDARNDDWLISPELSGAEQEVSFFARSLNANYGLESFEFAYSLTGKLPSDFIKVAQASSDATPVNWTEYVALLPEGAKYFAIHCTSPDRFALLVDDITFTPANAEVVELQRTGYRIYRDGAHEATADYNATEHTLTTIPNDGKSHSLHITALYDGNVESGGSHPVTVQLNSGLDLTSASATSMHIVAGQGYIDVICSEATHLTITDIAGRIVAVREVNAGSTRIPLPTGVYMVNSVKALVR